MQENRNNTVDSQERKLSQQQEVYFKDSKIRDENVNEKVLYHGIPQDLQFLTMTILVLTALEKEII